MTASTPPSGTLWKRIWPGEFLALREEPNAVLLLPETEYPLRCPNCHGWGAMMLFLIRDGPFPHPRGGRGECRWLTHRGRSGWWLGETKVEFCPVCRQGEKDLYLERNSGLSGRDLRISLQDFQVIGELSPKAPALETARRLLGMNQRPAGFVTFTSREYGVGKTFLLKALVNGFRAVDVLARYIPLPDLLVEIREKFGEADASDRLIAETRRAAVLCLDELDKAHLTGWALETIFRLLNSRYEERERLLTVLATNTPPEQMPPELGYLASRMQAGQVIEVAGPDVRRALGAG